VIDARALEQLGMQDRGFGWTIEMQIKAARNGLVVREIPVPYRKRIGTSKISGTLWGSLRAGTTILALIAKYWLKSRRELAKGAMPKRSAGMPFHRLN
jgi:hypothetical protein